MTGNINVPLYMNPTSTPQQEQALQMMRAQLIAQQLQQSGQMPADNEMAGNVVVQHSPLEYLSRQVSQNMGTMQQLKAAQMQMQLMGQNMGGSGAAGGASAGTGIDPSQLRKAAMYDVMYGAGSGKAYLDSIQPTPDMKTAGSVGMNALDYNNKNAQNTAAANAGMKPTTYTTPDGRTMQTTEAALAGMAGGGQPQQRLPLNAVNNAMGGMGNPDVAPAGMPSGSPPAIPNGAAVPPIPAVQGAPMPPPAGFAQANGSIPPQTNAIAPMAGFKDPSQVAPPSIAPQQTTQNSPPIPFSQMVQNSAPNMGGMQVQSPSQKTGADEAAKNGITVQNDINSSAEKALELKRNLAQMTNYFQDFTPGKAAGLRQAIAEYEVQAGSQDPETVKLAGATEGIDKLAATQALETMKAMNSIGGGSGQGGNRVEFQSLLQNTPNKEMTPQAAKSIIDFMNKGADMTLNKQQAFSDWKKGKNYADYQDFPAQWEKQQAANIPSTLSNIQTAQPARVINYDATGKRVQ